MLFTTFLQKQIFEPLLCRATNKSAILYKLDNNYTNLKKYSPIDTNKFYNNCVKDICQRRLKYMLEN